MIAALSETAEGLVQRPQSYDELKARPDFREPLDHHAFALKSVLADYHFAAEVPCGLKRCRQPHKHGYLVLTDGGHETNIGQRCGKTHFGDEVFNSARADYIRRREREDLVARARQLQALAPDIDAAVKDVAFRDFGAKWALRVKEALKAVIGADLVDSLRVASVRGELQVTSSRRRSDEEIADFLAVNRGAPRERAIYEDVVVGHLFPMPWLDFDFHEKLMVNLAGPLKSFAQFVPESLPSPRLKAEVKRFDGYEKALEDAAEAAASALRFLAEDNLQLVAQWFPSHHRGAAASLRDWIAGKEHRALLHGSPK